MEASTGEDLSWFFEDWIQTTKRNDLELRKASTRKGLVVRNRGELASSAKVSGLRGDSVVAVLDVPLMQPGSKVSLAHPDVAGVDRWVLDHERVTLDYDRRNNSRQTRLFGGVEPFQLRLLSRLENPEQTQVFWMPALGWNAHNGPMAGLVIHNLMLPPRDFTYQWTPLFSANAEGVDFGGILNLDWRKRDWHVGIRSSQFRAEEALQMRPDVTLGNYDGELLTRTSWEIGRTLNANPVSAWKGRFGMKGRTCLALSTPRWMRCTRSSPIQVACGCKGVLRGWRGAQTKLPLAVPGLRQTGSLILGRVATDGFKSTGVVATTDPPLEVVNPAHVSHVFADAWWHASTSVLALDGRTRWSIDARASRVSSSSWKRPPPAGGRAIATSVCQTLARRWPEPARTSTRWPISCCSTEAAACQVWTVDGPDVKRPSTAVGCPWTWWLPRDCGRCAVDSVTASAWKSLRVQPAPGTTAAT